MASKKTHSITVATALALGYASGFATDGLVAAASREEPVQEVYDGVVAANNSVVSSIKSQAEGVAQSRFNGEWGSGAYGDASAEVCQVCVEYCDADRDLDDDGVAEDQRATWRVWVQGTAHKVLGPAQ